MFRKRFLAAAVAITFSASVQAGINSEMMNFFNELGVYSNVTGPQVLTGQTGTTFAGGSLYMRAPQRNYQLAHLALPSIRAGCGGIDLFAGSFSFMNAEQLTAMLRNLANNAIGVAFVLAMESMTPELTGVIKWAQDIANKVNSMNLTSCQMATGLVTAAWPDQAAVKRAADKRAIDPQYNLAQDALKSWFNFSNNPPSQTKNEISQIVQQDPLLKEKFDNINVVWNALSRINVTDNDLRDLMMSLTGTIIIQQNNDDGSKPNFIYKAPPEKISFKTFIGNPYSGTANVKVMTCSDSECLTLGERTTTATSFAKYARDKISSIISKIANRQSSSLTGDEYKFIQGTFVPIWKIASMPNSIYAQSLVDTMSELIAMDMAFSYFNEISKELQKAISNSKSTDSQANLEQLDRMQRRLAEIRAEASRDMNIEASRLTALLGMQQAVARIDAEIKRGMPEQIKQSIATFNGR